MCWGRGECVFAGVVFWGVGWWVDEGVLKRFEMRSLHGELNEVTVWGRECVEVEVSVCLGWG